jgi:hypothetical protein
MIMLISRSACILPLVRGDGFCHQIRHYIKSGRG